MKICHKDCSDQYTRVRGFTRRWRIWIGLPVTMPPLGHSEVLWNSLTSKGNRIKSPLYSSKEVLPNSPMRHYYCMPVSYHHTILPLCRLSLRSTFHTMSFTERGPGQRGRRKYLLGHSQGSLMQGDISARCGYFTTPVSALLCSSVVSLWGPIQDMAI